MESLKVLACGYKFTRPIEFDLTVLNTELGNDLLRSLLLNIPHVLFHF